ncbi:MAG: glycine cleavage system protein R [Gammaproteobacteria bacterium]
MPSTLILSIMGPDRPGLVETLSGTLLARGANWTESRMSRLGNQFAGIVLISVPDDEVVALEHDLGELRARGLRVSVDSVRTPIEHPMRRTIRLEFTGQDRPGLVQKVAEAVATAGISIEELDTRCESAPWSGETIFRARAVLSAPSDMVVEALMQRFEAIANELMVEISVHELTSARPRLV